MKSSSRNIVLAAATAVLAFGAVAVANAVLGAPDVTTPGPVALSQDEVPDPPATGDAGSEAATSGRDRPVDGASTGGVDEERARQAALDHVGEGEVVRVRADQDDGRSEWEVVLLLADGRLVEVDVDAVSGTVVDVDTDDDVDDPAARRAATIDEDRARTVALDHVGEGEVVRVLAESDDGRPEWEVTVLGPQGTLTEVTIDAVDGRVTDVDVE